MQCFVFSAKRQKNSFSHSLRLNAKSKKFKNILGVVTMMNNVYVQAKENKHERFNNFEMFFAFDNKQFEKGLEKLEVNSDEIVSIGMNGFIRKSDVTAFNEMMESFRDEHIKNMKNDDYVYHMFKYEMSNHEYIITYDDEEVLSACDIDEHEFIADERLKEIYIKARKEYIQEVTA
jgi:hypothetical protein